MASDAVLDGKGQGGVLRVFIWRERDFERTLAQITMPERRGGTLPVFCGVSLEI